MMGGNPIAGKPQFNFLENGILCYSICAITRKGYFFGTKLAVIYLGKHRPTAVKMFSTYQDGVKSSKIPAILRLLKNVMNIIMIFHQCNFF